RTSGWPRPKPCAAPPCTARVRSDSTTAACCAPACAPTSCAGACASPRRCATGWAATSRSPSTRAAAGWREAMAPHARARATDTVPNAHAVQFPNRSRPMSRTTDRLALALALALIAPGAVLAQATDAARALAADALIVDTHIDAPGVLVSRWADLGQAAPDREFDYPRAREGGLDVAFMSIYTSARQDETGTAWQAANAQIDAIEALAARHPDRFALLTSPGDVERLRTGGRVLLPLGMENGAPIGDDLSQLAFFHARGIRYITLAHSGNNRIADSSYTVEKRWNGLSPFGRDVIAEMNRLGIMVDVSHLSDAAVRQAVELSTVPVIASHSALRHFTPDFERNLSDELAKLIAAKGGVVQIP